MSLTLGISPCPNDTFAFHALVHGLVDAPEVEPHLLDIDELNRLAALGELDVVKVSVAAYAGLRERYALLRAGGAAGFGVGPVLVAARRRAPGGRIAIPGDRTTAALLLRLLGRFTTISMPFHAIADAVRRGQVDCGVLIHEGRFTYADRGLVLLRDLGELWETKTGLPVPLGAVAIRRDLGEDVARRMDAAIRASVLHARENPEACAPWVAQHAREMDPAVIRRHIELYVNDYTLRGDPQAVAALLSFAATTGARPPASDLPVFAA